LEHIWFEAYRLFETNGSKKFDWQWKRKFLTSVPNSWSVGCLEAEAMPWK